MADQGVSVIAHVQAKKGAEKKVKQQLMSLIAPTRSEAGCITYVLHQAVDDAGHFMFYENWVSRKDLDGHLKKPYLKTFMERAKDFLEGPVKITLWEMIG